MSFYITNGQRRLGPHYLPIHELCYNEKLNDEVSIDILRFMISIDPLLVRERSDFSSLPIHSAVRGKSMEFCKILIEAYPESLREGLEDDDQMLPIHVCCSRGDKDTSVLQYLLALDPERSTPMMLKGIYLFTQQLEQEHGGLSISYLCTTLQRRLGEGSSSCHYTLLAKLSIIHF